MDVSDWVNVPRLVIPRSLPSRRQWPVRMIGLFGTLALHSTIVMYFYVGMPIHKPLAHRSWDTNASPASANSDGAQSLTLITLPTLSENPPVSRVTFLAGIESSMPVSTLRVDPPESINVGILTLDDETSSRATAEGGNGDDRTRLSGIYMGQIRARIDRMWRRPRTPVNE